MKFVIVTLALMGLAALEAGAQSNRGSDATRIATTPVPILKQINKVNEDGSYTYGYENADGSYKIETKDTNGQVQGKYGYYDDAGTLREVEYGASKSGFYPSGTDIKTPEVAPHRPDVHAPTDGSYDPNLFTYPYSYENELAQQGGFANQPNAPTQIQGRRIHHGRKTKNAAARQLSLFQQEQPQQQYQSHSQPAPRNQYQEQQYQQPQQQYQQPQQQYQQQYQQPQQQQYQQPQYQPPQQYQQPYNPAQLFQGHPARNIDLSTGSYSVNYSG